MDAKSDSVDSVLDSGLKLCEEGNYKGSNALLEPLLKGGGRKKRSLQRRNGARRVYVPRITNTPIIPQVKDFLASSYLV